MYDPARRERRITRRLAPAVRRGLAAALVVVALAGAPTVTAAISLTLLGADPGTLYLAQGGARTVAFVKHGAVVATRQLPAAATALALDAERGRLYVALGAQHELLVLDGDSLRDVVSLHLAGAASALSAVPGYNALYMVDASSKQTLYLTYTAGGAVTTAPLFNPSRPAAAVGRVLHVTRAGTYWAGGFAPGESVAVSWGASDQGTVQADRQGLVAGALPIVSRSRPGLHVVGLYGLSSRLALTGMIDTARHPRRVRHHKAPPPLLLAALPGPVTTVTPPVLRHPVRVPLSAGALPAAPIMALLGLLSRRRRKRRRAARTAAKQPARRR